VGGAQLDSTAHPDQVVPRRAHPFDLGIESCHMSVGSPWWADNDDGRISRKSSDLRVGVAVASGGSLAHRRGSCSHRAPGWLSAASAARADLVRWSGATRSRLRGVGRSGLGRRRSGLGRRRSGLRKRRQLGHHHARQNDCCPTARIDVKASNKNGPEGVASASQRTQRDANDAAAIHGRRL